MPEPVRQPRPHNDDPPGAPPPLAATTIHQLRVLGLIEGASFLVLLLIAMPLKYLAGMPVAVRYVGMAHGLLFVLYVAAGLWTGISLRWPVRRTLAGAGRSGAPRRSLADRPLAAPAGNAPAPASEVYGRYSSDRPANHRVPRRRLAWIPSSRVRNRVESAPKPRVGSLNSELTLPSAPFRRTSWS